LSITTLVVTCFLLYVCAMFLVGRRREPATGAAAHGAAQDLFFVFVLPCLNEELVLDASLRRLFAFTGDNWVALVVDDGSEDATAEIAAGYDSDRVWLLRRSAPNARQGKGAALNAAYRHVQQWLAGSGRGSDRVILVVLDADGRIEPDALSTVAPLFADPRVGAVQIGVRMYNRDASLLARMQDMEFVVYTEIFQRSRTRFGTAGLGGNGQFTRLSALESLGQVPWSDHLTEDLDLSVRLQAANWLTRFTSQTFVSQEALTGLRPMLRQRARWFQGHLQSWSRIPLLIGSPASVGRTVDVLFILTIPALLLMITFSVVAFFSTLALFALGDPEAQDLLVRNGPAVVVWYLLAFGLVPLYAYVYRRAAGRIGLPRALLYAYAFSIYAYLWLPTGWWAVVRQLWRRRNWVKTLRAANTSTAD
jgi:cellulose synthase/poly-beta-1,6-N-acetylglucosamine synthase-like glycosyltransferase